MPLYSSTLPNMAISVPGGSCLARHGWLKNVTFRYEVSSKISISTSERPWRVRRPDTFFTVP